MKILRAIKYAYLDETRKHYTYRAAALSFYTLAAFVPLLIMITTILSAISHIAPTQINLFISNLETITVKSKLLHSVIINMLETDQTIYGFIGFVLSYYFSSRLFIALHRTLKLICDEPIGRQFFFLIRFLSVPILILCVIIMNIMNIGTIIILKYIQTTPYIIETVPAIFFKTTLNVSNIITFITFFLFIFLIYHFLTPRLNKRFRNSFALTVIVGFILTTLKNGFIIYLSVASHINPIYGGFGGLLGILIWLYISYLIILFGARVLFYIEQSPMIKRL